MKRALVGFVIALLCTSMALTACGKESPTTTSTNGSGPTTSGAPVGPGSSTETSLPPTSTSTPLVEPEYLPPQPVDLAAISNLHLADLSDQAKQTLARQSFVATELDPVNGFWKFWQVYEALRYQGLPALVTTDSVLNAYHGLFDTLLQRMEEAALFEQALIMSQALYAAASDQWNSATDPVVKEDARLNMAYFAVAASLLQDALAAPDVVRDEVEAELALSRRQVGRRSHPSSDTPRTTASTSLEDTHAKRNARTVFQDLDVVRPHRVLHQPAPARPYRRRSSQPYPPGHPHIVIADRRSQAGVDGHLRTH